MRHSFEIEGTADPETDLISVDDLKVELDVSDDTDDDSLERLIARLSRGFAEYCDRSFALLDVTETFAFETGECFRTGAPLILRQYPIVSVVSVKVNDVETTDYVIDKDSGRIWLNNSAWSGTVEIQYSGGFDLPDNAPSLLQSALIDAIRQRRAFSGSDPTVRSVAHGDTSISYNSESSGNSSGFPEGVTQVLNGFCRKSF